MGGDITNTCAECGGQVYWTRTGWLHVKPVRLGTAHRIEIARLYP